jgi:hypothetical protein
VPGHFCGCVGIKPTVGRFSTTGVVQACRSLDCVSVFARSVADGALVARIMQVFVSCCPPALCTPHRLALCRVKGGTLSTCNMQLDSHRKPAMSNGTDWNPALKEHIWSFMACCGLTLIPPQDAGQKLEDPNWRLRPPALPSFGTGACKGSNRGPVTPEQSPVTHSGAPPSPGTNGNSAPRFKFGVPGREYLSFAGPGGDDFAQGKQHFNLHADQQQYR